MEGQVFWTIEVKLIKSVLLTNKLWLKKELLQFVANH